MKVSDDDLTDLLALARSLIESSSEQEREYGPYGEVFHDDCLVNSDTLRALESIIDRIEVENEE